MITKEELEQKYLQEKKSLGVVANEFGCSKKKISYWIKKYNIKKRTLKEARNNRSAKGKEFRDIVDINMLVKYYEAGNSMQQCAAKFNIGYTSVQDRLSTLNISRKSWHHRINSNHSKSTKEKMSNTAVEQIKTGTRNSHSQGNSYYCMSTSQDRIRVRSSWERDYADHLFANNIKFLYEHKSFNLSNGKSYVPDFYLSDTDEYIEIKGYLSDEQSDKYKLFRKEYPNIVWKMLRKSDLKNILREEKKKEVMVICGTMGSGKSYVGNRLTSKYNVIDYDKDKKYIETIRSLKCSKPVLLQLPFKVSTFIRRYSHEFDISAVSITGDPLKVKQNLLNRGGKITKTFYSRSKRIKSLTKKYCEFSGSSQEVLKYLKNLKNL